MSDGHGVTARFARQHDVLAELAKSLLRMLDADALHLDPTPARRTLAVFSGRLRVHAVMEQEALYPRLLASSDPSVAAKAQELLDDVGDIYRAFFAHMSRWSSAASIQADFAAFKRDTKALLHRLHTRMKRENDELYPLVDRSNPGKSGERPVGLVAGSVVAAETQPIGWARASRDGGR